MSIAGVRLDPAMSPGWVLADAWVLAAIGVHRRPCSLADVIASGDWIEHAILLEDEIEVALGKLTGADLVRVFENWTFELTDMGETLWAGEGGAAPGRITVVLAQLLAVEPGSGIVSLPQGAMEKAVVEYRDR